MNKIIRTEYNAPKTTIFVLSTLSVMCASQRGTSVETFEEDAEVVW